MTRNLILIAFISSLKIAPSNRRMVTSTLKDYEWQIYGNDMEDVDAIREIFERKLRKQ